MRYLTAAQIARAVERHERTIRRWVARGALPKPLPGVGTETPRWDAAAVAVALRAGGYAVPVEWEISEQAAA